MKPSTKQYFPAVIDVQRKRGAKTVMDALSFNNPIGLTESNRSSWQRYGMSKRYAKIDQTI